MRDLCTEFNILQSFSKKGCPYDNACIESFHASIKKIVFFCLLKQQNPSLIFQ